ncbi:hypothetical protein [Sphingomonas baiyangensis]|nr:hypothetical protein [Sphingomonas baiyangensis]
MLATLLLIVAMPAQAQEPAAAKDDKPVCRTFRPAGSRTGGERVCKTKAEWEAHARLQRNSGGAGSTRFAPEVNR